MGIGRKKTNQRELLFYLLYKFFKTFPDKNIVPFKPLWEFQGEHFITELNEWTFMSYEVSTTMSKLKRDEPALFEEQEYKCKNGSTALTYRISPTMSSDKICTKEIREFWLKIKS